MLIDAKTQSCLKRALTEAMSERQKHLEKASELDADIIALRRLVRNGAGEAEADARKTAENGSNVSHIRDALRAAQEIGGGGHASVAEVTRFLEEEGFSLKGTTPLRTYVGAELSRMARKKQDTTVRRVGKVGKGEYRYTK